MRRDEFWAAMSVMAIGGAMCLAVIAHYGGGLAFTWGVFLAVVNLTIGMGLGWLRHHGF